MKQGNNQESGEFAEKHSCGYSDSDQQQVFENRIACEWLSTKEAAHYLRLSENALRIMVHRGRVRALKLGRRLRFRLRDCEALFTKKGA